VLVLAKLAGMKSLLGTSEWIQDQEHLLREGLQLSWKRMPYANIYWYALARLDSQEANAVLAAWFMRREAASRCGKEPSRLVAHPSERYVHLASDGKVWKGTGKQVLHRYEVQTGMVLQQCPMAREHTEVSTLKPLLTEGLCKGRMVTTDAAQSYHEFGRLVKPSRRRHDGVRQRQYAGHTGGPGTVF
jgi:hypothetical protein